MELIEKAKADALREKEEEMSAEEVLLQLERRARAQKLISATRHSLEQQKSNDEISLKSTTSADEVAALGDEARPGEDEEATGGSTSQAREPSFPLPACCHP